VIWIALSAPKARECLKASAKVLGPIDNAITSLTMFFSFSLTASSTAISQKGLMIYLPDKSTPEPSGLTLIFRKRRRNDHQIKTVINIK